jgi:hypothetical protein
VSDTYVVTQRAVAPRGKVVGWCSRSSSSVMCKRLGYVLAVVIRGELPRRGRAWFELLRDLGV